MEPVKMAILGAGRIAHAMAQTIMKMKEVEAYAVASREPARAEEFAKQYGFKRAYGSYAEMLADPQVELVYIATPHSHHAEQAIRSLRAGKHILVEKAFAVNAEQARQVTELSRKTGLLAAEAIWPRYLPMAGVIREFCESGKIGKITGLTANLGYAVWHKDRLHMPELAGGALLDIGIYPLTLASIAFGDPISHVTSTAQMSESGIDMQETIVIAYLDGRTASLYASAVSITDRRGIICGEEGYAVIENINNYESLTVYGKEHKIIERVARPVQITGFEYEVRACVEAIRSGAYECEQMPHHQIILTMELMDHIRRIWGLRYPME